MKFPWIVCLPLVTWFACLPLFAYRCLHAAAVVHTGSGAGRDGDIRKTRWRLAEGEAEVGVVEKWETVTLNLLHPE